jgi:hypothetical protein
MKKKNFNNRTDLPALAASSHLRAKNMTRLAKNESVDG